MEIMYNPDIYQGPDAHPDFTPKKCKKRGKYKCHDKKPKNPDRDSMPDFGVLFLQEGT